MAGIDEGWCLHGDFHKSPYNCHDVAEFVNAAVRVFIDGHLISESPALQMQTLPWIFDVPLDETARILRIVVTRATTTTRSEGSMVGSQQDAYDYVDLVGGFM
mmetsp:Transcript_74491/g.174850  ORF Transcript_74491/g.174850 Transcript_74491/m.174850 type:complete len:103 (+) Transcript_74491:151-459(+)